MAKKFLCFVVLMLAVICFATACSGSKDDLANLVGALEGNEAENTIYVEIETVEDLQKLSGSNEAFALKNDLDLQGVDWTPIKDFSGTLNGKGYSIKNLKIELSEDNVGFFSVLNGTVTDIKFENAAVTVSGTHENVGVVCGLSQKGGALNNVSVTGEVKAKKSTCVGGIVGRFESNETFESKNLHNEAAVTGKENVGGVCGFLDCWFKSYKTKSARISGFSNKGEVLAEENHAGGIIGKVHAEAYDYMTFDFYAADLNNTGNVSGKAYVGGLFGLAFSDGAASNILDSKSAASISSEYMVGGLAGKLENIAINSCENEGSVINATKYMFEEGTKYGYVGGYAGYGYIASDCKNTVDIDYTGGGNYVGGIFGYSDATAIAYECGELHNTGNIKGADYVGGIWGYSKSEESFSILDLQNDGAIDGNCYVGGIGGYMECWIGSYKEATATLSDFVNTGAVKAGKCVGGTIGAFHSEAYDYMTYLLYVSEFNNTGSVSGTSYVGGLIGDAYADGTESCISDSNVSANISGSYFVGGLAGQLNGVQVTDCTNSGSTVSASGYVTEDDVKCTYLGGFVGKGGLINDCTNMADVISTSAGGYIGGVMGYAYLTKTFTMTDLHNQGDVAGETHVGGIFGEIECYSRSTSESATLIDCTNDGSVRGVRYVGGIAGYVLSEAWYTSEYILVGDEFPFYAVELINNGEITGYAFVGGIFGSGKTDSESSVIQDCDNNGTVTGDESCSDLTAMFTRISIKYTK